MTDWNMWNDPRYSWDAQTQPQQWPPPGGTIYDPTRDGPPVAFQEPGTVGAPAPGAQVGAPPPPAAAAPGTPDQQNANSIIQQFLGQVGLGELADWAWQQIVDGNTPSQIELQLYDPTSTPGKVVDRLYPEISQRRANGLPPLSIGDAVTYRNQAIQLMRASGLPATFYDQPDDLAKFAANDVSLAELKSRIDEAQSAALQADPTERAELQRLYGVGTGDIAAVYLDPNRALPVLQQRFAAAQESASAVRGGYGGLSQSEAEHLAALGVSPNQAQGTFGKLAGMGELFGALPGEAGSGVSREQQLAAGFDDNAQAQQAIERQRAARLAVFGSGAGFGTAKAGVTGLGVAAT